MKKIFLTMVALLSMTAMMAQNDKSDKKAPKEPTPEEMTARMAKDLNLTDDQKTKVLALNKEYKDMFKGGPRMGGPRGPKPDGKSGATDNQQRPERPQMTDAQKAEMKKHMEQRKAYDTKLKSILTADQYKSWQKQHKRGPKGGPRDGKRPDKVSQE
ncbi:MAG: DUF4890 domain-containing protein [Prevotella sp.]|nr:DUF4890 domain-containing protein [Prevotella sp.]